LDRLFGTNVDREYEETVNQVKRQSAQRVAGMSDDERAIERYRYLLQTAPPEALEHVHAEAFAALTPEQRQQVFESLKATAPAGDAPRAADPQSLAVSATRSEMRQPGTLERAFSGAPGGAALGGGFGSMFAGSLMGNIAGFFIASTLMNAFMPDFGGADSGVDSGADSGAGTASDGGSMDASGIDASGMDGGFDAGGLGDFGDFGF
jgi:hypothetical protein